MQIKPEWHIFFEATAHLINALLHQPPGIFHWLGPIAIFNFTIGKPHHRTHAAWPCDCPRLWEYVGRLCFE